MAVTQATAGVLADGAVTTAKIADGAVTTAKIADGAVTSAKTTGLNTVPAGVVSPYAGASAPTGWLLCYGQAVSRTTYADLFTAISTTYGVGDGSTTFNLPDLRGRVAAGKDDMGGAAVSRLTTGASGVDGATLGASGGSETHTLTVAQLATHTHALSGVTIGTGGAHSHTVTPTNSDENASVAGAVAQTGAAGGAFSTSTHPGHVHSISGTIDNAGSGSAHNNVQPTFTLNYIIRS